MIKNEGLHKFASTIGDENGHAALVWQQLSRDCLFRSDKCSSIRKPRIMCSPGTSRRHGWSPSLNEHFNLVRICGGRLNFAPGLPGPPPPRFDTKDFVGMVLTINCLGVMLDPSTTSRSAPRPTVRSTSQFSTRLLVVLALTFCTAWDPGELLGNPLTFNS